MNDIAIDLINKIPLHYLNEDMVPFEKDYFKTYTLLGYAIRFKSKKNFPIIKTLIEKGVKLSSAYRQEDDLNCDKNESIDAVLLSIRYNNLPILKYFLEVLKPALEEKLKNTEEISFTEEEEHISLSNQQMMVSESQNILELSTDEEKALFTPHHHAELEQNLNVLNGVGLPLNFLNSAIIYHQLAARNFNENEVIIYPKIPHELLKYLLDQGFTWGYPSEHIKLPTEFKNPLTEQEVENLSSLIKFLWIYRQLFDPFWRTIDETKINQEGVTGLASTDSRLEIEEINNLVTNSLFSTQNWKENFLNLAVNENLDSTFKRGCEKLGVRTITP